MWIPFRARLHERVVCYRSLELRGSVLSILGDAQSICHQANTCGLPRWKILSCTRVTSQHHFAWRSFVWNPNISKVWMGGVSLRTCGNRLTIKIQTWNFFDIINCRDCINIKGLSSWPIIYWYIPSFTIFSKCHEENTKTKHDQLFCFNFLSKTPPKAAPPTNFVASPHQKLGKCFLETPCPRAFGMACLVSQKGGLVSGIGRPKKGLISSKHE